MFKNGSGIVPNHVGIYGSAYEEFVIKENSSVDALFEIKESQTKALDKKSRRCDESQDPPSVSKCVGKFMHFWGLTIDTVTNPLILKMIYRVTHRNGINPLLTFIWDVLSGQ